MCVPFIYNVRQRSVCCEEKEKVEWRVIHSQPVWRKLDKDLLIIHIVIILIHVICMHITVECSPTVGRAGEDSKPRQTEVGVGDLMPPLLNYYTGKGLIIIYSSLYI